MVQLAEIVVVDPFTYTFNWCLMKYFCSLYEISTIYSFSIVRMLSDLMKIHSLFPVCNRRQSALAFNVYSTPLMIN